MITIGIREFRTRLTEYVKAVASGTETIAISCRGQTLAMVIKSDSLDKSSSKSPEVPEARDKAKHVDSSMLRSNPRSQELRQLAKDRYGHLETLDRNNLGAVFATVTSVVPDDRLSDRQLRIAIARIYQLSLWTEQIGFVPGDIATRDLKFWLQLLNSLTTATPEK